MTWRGGVGGWTRPGTRRRGDVEQDRKHEDAGRIHRAQGRLVALLTGLAMVGCRGSSEAHLPGGAPPQPALVVRTQPCPVTPVDPGRVTLHRLNATEYDRTVRDLLGDDTAPSKEFPTDDSSGGGFDNDADVLVISPLLMERYQAAAEQLIAEAWARDVAGSTAPSVRICEPMAKTDDRTCTRRTLESFLRRAWRRPVTAEEVDRHLGLVTAATQDGDTVEQGLQWALSAALLSPHFLYRVELDPDPHSDEVHRVSDVELASRLSYFLWSSMPDETLLSRRREGRAAQARGARGAGGAHAHRSEGRCAARQLRRPVAGAARVRSSPAGHDGSSPSSTMRCAARCARRPSASSRPSCTRSCRSGTSCGRTSPTWMIASRSTTACRCRSSQTPVRVQLPPGSPRGGLLGQGSILTVTAYPNRTSPVRRGHFVLTRLLCQQPPPPPPNVEGLPGQPEPGMSLRQRLEEHISNPTCAACHQMMDPIGFSMEEFDAIGRGRTVEADSGALIDTSGSLPDGTSFVGSMELATILRDDPELTACVSRHLLTYALGREVREQDQCHLQDMAWRAELKGASVRDLIGSLITSRPFTHRRGEPKETP